MPQPRPQRPIQDSYLSMLAVFTTALFILPTLAQVAAATLVPRNNAMQQAVGLLLQQVLFGCLALLHLRINLRVSWTCLGLELAQFTKARNAVWAGLVLVLVNGVSLWLSRLLAATLVGPGRALALYHQEEATLMGLFRYESATVVAVLLFTVVVVTPLAEELLFRGYLYRALHSRVGVHAIWLSSLLFTAMHFYVIHALPVFLVALGFTWLYARTGALWVSIVAHATLNGAIACILIIQRI